MKQTEKLGCALRGRKWCWELSLLACCVGLGVSAFADLTEGEFPNQTGSLHKQNGWEVQKPEAGGWVEAWDAVQVEQDDQGDNVIVWQAGAGPKEQVRIVRPFPPTKSDKVRISFAFKPGAESLGGRLYFMQTAQLPVMALQFKAGNVLVVEGGQTQATDTGVGFSPEDWNRIEIRVDFTKHTAELIINGTPVGHYEIPASATALGLVNLFAGGQTHASTLKGLTIEGVSSF
ncbi:MAG: hypothetical protein IAE94_09860 [Chthoniobacterales bacterium]|nr:hypothetical protein [Chthoniobacterales bacterium]